MIKKKINTDNRKKIRTIIEQAKKRCVQHLSLDSKAKTKVTWVNNNVLAIEQGKKIMLIQIEHCSCVAGVGAFGLTTFGTNVIELLRCQKILTDEEVKVAYDMAEEFYHNRRRQEERQHLDTLADRFGYRLVKK